MRPDDHDDPFIEHLAARLREPVVLSAEVERVVLDRLRAEAAAGTPAAANGSPGGRRFGPRGAPAATDHVGPRLWRRPAVAAALAASVAAAFAGGMLVGRWSARPSVGSAAVRPVEFALRTPADSAVVLVGDFNDWNPVATPLHRAPDGVWSVSVPLRPGRYRYTFIVDGTRWRRDPAAPRALEDDFGAPTSVITIAQR